MWASRTRTSVESSLRTGVAQGLVIDWLLSDEPPRPRPSARFREHRESVGYSRELCRCLVSWIFATC
jgi:hypothetical protein